MSTPERRPRWASAGRAFVLALAACGPEVPGSSTDATTTTTGTSSGESPEPTGANDTTTAPSTSSSTGDDVPVDCAAVCDAPWTHDGDLTISPKTDPASLHCLRAVAGDLRITGFTGSLPGELRALQEVGDRLLVLDNPGLVDLAGLECLQRTDAVFIEANPALADVAALAGVETSAALEVNECDALVDLSPLSNITDIRQFHLSDNPVLTTLPAFPIGTRLDRLTIFSCPALTDLDALAGVRGPPVQLSLHTAGLSSIAGIAGMWEDAEEASGTVVLYDLPQLASLTGLEGMSAASDLLISGLPQLDSLAPLGDLRSVSNLRLQRLPALTSLAGLSQLEQIGTLEIGSCNPDSGAAIVDLTGLVAVTELGELHLDDNPALQSLAGLDALVTGPSEVLAVDNPSLSPDEFTAFVAAHAVPVSCQDPPESCTCSWAVIP